MLLSQRALFDIPEHICYLNAAAVGPLPRAVKQAGELGVARKAQPWAKWPHRTIRGFGHRCGSIVATYPLLVRAVYTWQLPWSSGRRLP